MRVKLAVIPPDGLTGIMHVVDDLRNAVNTGDMDGVDAATEKLVALTAKTRSVDLSEDEWRRFLADVRAKNTASQSDYLVTGELCTQYFPDATAGTMVLQLPLNEREGDDV